jgi:nucleotide-binding universal stress UspA family protein
MYKHVLVAVDPSHGEVGARIVEVARHLAGADGHITLLSALEPVPSYVANYIPRDATDRIRTTTEAALRDLAQKAGPGSRVVIANGTAAHAILAEAEQAGCDAIVLGSHRPDYRDYLIGSTAARVVRHAQCTVIVERSSP